MENWAKFCVATLLTLLSACKPLEDQRTGHDIEDIEVISAGPLAGHVAILDGYDIFTVPVDNNSGKPRDVGLKKLFDLKNVGIERAPHGITYIPPLSAFAFTDVGSEQSRSRLLLIDEHGRVKPPLSIKYPRGEIPVHLEGLSYIPEGAPQYPNTILMVALFDPPGFKARIDIIDLTGQVVAELNPGAPLDTGFVGGLSFQAPDRLLVDRCDHKAFTLDFSGSVVAGPQELTGGNSFEGIGVAPDGRLIFADYYQSELRYYTPNFERLPQDDHGYQFGVQVSSPTGLAWDTPRQRFVVQHVRGHGISELTGQFFFSFAVSDVDAHLDQSSTLFDVPEELGSARSSLMFIPEESRYASLTRAAHMVFFERNGTVADDVDLSAYAPVRAADYVPAWKTFVINSGKAGSEKTLTVIDRHGVRVRDIVINAPQLNIPLSLTHIPRGSKTHFVVTDDPAKSTNLVEIDEHGNVLHSVDYHKSLGIVRPTDLTFIDSGPDHGSIAVIDSDSSELAVFLAP